VFRIRINFKRIRIQGLKNLPMRIGIKSVKNVRIRIQVFFFNKNLCLFTSKNQKRILSPDENADPDPDPDQDPGTKEDVDPDPRTPTMRIQ